MRTLLVDDDEAARRYLRTLLTEAHADVEVVSEAAAAGAARPTADDVPGEVGQGGGQHGRVHFQVGMRPRLVPPRAAPQVYGALGPLGVQPSLGLLELGVGARQDAGADVGSSSLAGIVGQRVSRRF